MITNLQALYSSPYIFFATEKANLFYQSLQIKIKEMVCLKLCTKKEINIFSPCHEHEVKNCGVPIRN